MPSSPATAISLYSQNCAQATQSPTPITNSRVCNHFHSPHSRADRRFSGRNLYPEESWVSPALRGKCPKDKGGAKRTQGDARPPFVIPAQAGIQRGEDERRQQSPLPRWARVRVRVNGVDKWEVYGKRPPSHPSITTPINPPYTLQLALQHPLKPTLSNIPN